MTNKPKGGPLARLSGLLCANPKFQQFVGATGQDQAADAIRARCQVSSRAELDHNKAAAKRFHELVRRPFAELQEQNP